MFRIVLSVLIIAVSLFVMFMLFDKYLFNDTFNHQRFEGTVVSAPMLGADDLYVIVEGGVNIILNNTRSVGLPNKEDPALLQASLVVGKKYRFVATGYEMFFNSYRQNLYQALPLD